MPQCLLQVITCLLPPCIKYFFSLYPETCVFVCVYIGRIPMFRLACVHTIATMTSKRDYDIKEEEHRSEYQRPNNTSCELVKLAGYITQHHPHCFFPHSQKTNNPCKLSHYAIL